MRLLAVLLLQFAPNEQIEFLVRPPELKVRLQRHRVIALHQRIEQLVHRDGDAAPVASREIFPLQHARQGVTRCQLDHAARAQGIRPFRVVANLGTLRIKHQTSLAIVGCRIGFDLFACERRSRGVAPRRVTDGRREITDQKYDRVPQILELAHLVQDHRMPEMQIGCGRIQTQLDPERLVLASAAFELARKLRFNQQFVCPTTSHVHGRLDRIG